MTRHVWVVMSVVLVLHDGGCGVPLGYVHGEEGPEIKVSKNINFCWNSKIIMSDLGGVLSLASEEDAGEAPLRSATATGRGTRLAL